MHRNFFFASPALDTSCVCPAWPLHRRESFLCSRCVTFIRVGTYDLPITRERCTRDHYDSKTWLHASFKVCPAEAVLGQGI